MTKSTSFTRKVRQRRNAITPTAMEKLHALDKLYKQTLPPPYSWSDTHPNTIMENSCSVCVCVCVCVCESKWEMFIHSITIYIQFVHVLCILHVQIHCNADMMS